MDTPFVQTVIFFQNYHNVSFCQKVTKFIHSFQICSLVISQFKFLAKNYPEGTKTIVLLLLWTSTVRDKHH